MSSCRATNAKRHRIDGPAIERVNGDKFWYLNGEHHREDGPAFELANGYKSWFLNGQLHREDGPAIEHANGEKQWYLNGKKLSEEEFNLKIVTKEYPKKEITSKGIFWRNENGEYHREDGPACERVNGTKEWWLNGHRHRIDGPAVEWANGDKCWYLNGNYHREDGPAIEFINGQKYWYLNGKKLSEEEFNLKMNINKYPKKEVTSEGTFWRNKNGEYHCEDGPACERVNGTKEWWLNGHRHRIDGPAIEWSNGDKEWYLNGNYHREDGPAIEWSNGQKYWYLNGKKLSEEEFNLKMNINKYPKKEVTSEGTFWRNERSEYHRVDGPACEYANGTKHWYLNGQLHRVDGPACEWGNGSKEWFLNGKLHREDGPACEYANGEKYWYLNGKLHRVDGPACEWGNGSKEWFLNGKLHREDGPACEYANGEKYWYLNGKQLSEEEFNLKIVTNKYHKKEFTSVGTFWRNENGEYHREDGPAIEYASGTKEWWLNGKLHREDGPAFEGANGEKSWWLNGELHREDGPAVENVNGNKSWYLNGKRHREDGPAIECVNSDNEWFLNGEKLSEKEYISKIAANKYPKKEVTSVGTFWRNENGEYHRKDGPAVERLNGDKFWYLNGKSHRVDGPACEYASGDKSWWLNGQLHREDGPAIEHANGRKEWFLNSQHLSEEEFKLKMSANKYPKKEITSEGTFWYNEKGEYHREDGPAVEWSNGDKEWYLNDQRHREDGPAIEWADGDKRWYINGKLHRVDGPAIESANGYKEWYLNGQQLSEKEFKLKTNTKEYPKKEVNSNGTFWRNEEGQFHREDGPAIEYVNGDKYWYLNGKNHRVDGPAIEYASGDKSWYLNGKHHREDGPAIDWKDDKEWRLNGKLHRIDGPAIERVNGEKSWYLNDKCHREDGPAIEWANGEKQWYLNGEQLSEEEFNLKMNAKEYPKKEVNSNGIFWRNEKGEYHREDGPAIEWANGDKSWWLNGKLHRVDGPAVERVNGENGWYLNGEKLSEEEFNLKIASNKYPKKEVNSNGIFWRNEKGEYHREDGPAVEWANGDKSWYLNGKRHREDGPAVEHASGNKHWYLNGNCHREDGPAIEYVNGYKEWYLNGEQLSEKEFKLKMNAKEYPKKEVTSGGICWRNENGEYHREDGPAIEAVNGTKEWFLNGQRHRVDGPATELANGTKHWHLNGKLHREDGPAIESVNGEKHWYLNGKRLSEEEFKLKMNAKEYPKKEVTSSGTFWRNEKCEYHREDGPAIEWANGGKSWWLNGQLHREDGPAVEYANGNKYWYLNDQRHREDGPACENASGLKSWWLNGKRHREDGPAIERPNGDNEWYLNDEQLSKKEFKLKMNTKEYPKKEITSEGTFWRNENCEYHREDGPAVERVNGDKQWFLNGKRHRADGPACEYASGTKSWWLNGKRHRENGPAIECPNGDNEWYLNGEQLSEEEFKLKTNAKEFPKKELASVGTFWRNEKGELHREDGPAIEYANGEKSWWLNGELHRVDGPAVECVNGTKEWYLNGKLHREDGPAIEFASGSKEWYLNDEQLSEEEFKLKISAKKYPKKEVTSEGTVWRNEKGEYHREDGPAIEGANGNKEWYLNGEKLTEEEFKLKISAKKYPKKEVTSEATFWRNENGEYHREDGPAVERVNGDKQWFLNGKRHRIDGPAVEWVNGTKDWYLNGKRHREDGPAFEGANGEKSWWLNGKLHRIDGPAVEYTDDSKEWFLNGEQLSEEEFKLKTNAKEYPKKEVTSEGTFWRNEKGEIHREDGPAVERVNGDKLWYLNGKRHRIDGPAVEYANGSKEWYLNGQLHRVDGPAIEYANGSKEWYLNDQRHREDGPAIEFVDGYKSWYLNGKCHRVDGPAVEFADGTKSWHLNGKRISETEYEQAFTLNKGSSIFDEAKLSGFRIGVYQSKEILMSIVKKSLNTSAIEFANSDMGKSIIALSLGLVLKGRVNTLVDSIADELRVSALTHAGNSIIDEITNYVFPEITAALSKKEIYHKETAMLESSLKDRVVQTVGQAVEVENLSQTSVK